MADQNTDANESPEQSGSARRNFLKRTATATATCIASALPLPQYAATPSSVANCSRTKIPMREVNDKVAFITGGSSGIGLGIAQAFAGAGMKVAIGYRTTSNAEKAMTQLRSFGTRIIAINVDVTDRRGMESAAKQTVNALGKVHVLVNNAGVFAGTSLAKSTYDDWDWVLGVNLTGPFNGVRAFLPHIMEHGEGGQIVTTASIVGLITGGPSAIYATSKFGAVGMMEALRSELADSNVGASVFCPGYVKSSIWDADRSRPAGLSDTTSESMDPETKERARATVEKLGEALMDPLEAGRLVLRGVQNNDMYILSHPEFEQGIRDRNDALIASIPEDLHAPQARIAAERGILRNTMYISERERKRCGRAR